jgi:hypothetical protein
MKLKSSLHPLIGLSCLVSLQAIVPGRALADEVGRGCAQPTKENPLRFAANDRLSAKKFKTKAFFLRGLRSDAVLQSFEIITFKKYSEKYQSGVTCGISLNRMVAVWVIDYPKGLKTDRAEYSSARIMAVRDALTGEGIADEISGKVTKSFGPSVVFPTQATDNSSSPVLKTQLNNAFIDSGVKAFGSPSTIYENTEQMFGDADLVVVGKFSTEQIIVQVAPSSEGGLGHFDSGFTVTEVIKGKAETKLYVAQNGVIGATEAGSKPMEGDRFFKAGDSYILFLKKPLPHEVKAVGDRNFYYLVGGYQGGYRVKNGKVYSRDIEELDLAKLSKAPPNPAYGHRVDGVEVNSFVKYLKEIIS